MRIASRLRKLEAKVPKCGGRVLRPAGPDYAPSEADICKLCGGCHVLVIEEVIVETHEEVGRRSENEQADQT